MPLGLWLVLMGFMVRKMQANYLMGAIYSNGDLDTCLGTLVAEAAIPTQKCISVPQMSASSPFESFKFKCIQMVDGSITMKSTIYLDSTDCDGEGVKIQYSISESCISGMMISCNPETGADPSWNSIGLYFGDRTCKNPDMKVSVLPNMCVTAEVEESRSFSTTRDEEGGSMVAAYYSNSKCQGEKNFRTTGSLNTCHHSFTSHSLVGFDDYGGLEAGSRFGTMLFQKALLHHLVSKLKENRNIRRNHKRQVGEPVYVNMDVSRNIKV
jgi:hypothetical protein